MTQNEINIAVESNLESALNEFNDYHSTPKQLRHCSAVVYETENYYILRSYATIIAVIDKTTDTLYDALRLVYGYTATSAQHISKFNHDYCKGKWHCAQVYTGR